MELMEMKVKTVALDQFSNSVVILSDEEEKLVLPIWIGPFEAQAILLPLQDKVPPRPLTHDLLLNICKEAGGKIEKVVITDITPDQTYLAEIYMKHEKETKVIDSRPSDAIALALRERVPIFMTSKLLEYTRDINEIFPEEEEGGQEEGPLWQ